MKLSIDEVLEVVCDNCPLTFMVQDQERMNVICDKCRIEGGLRNAEAQRINTESENTP